jgi:hypothetical protein
MVAIADLPPLASPAQLEAYTKGKLKAEDARVADALAAVSRSIRRRAGWHIFPLVTAHTLVLDGPGGAVLSLPTLKLVTLTSLTDDGTVIDPSAGVRVSRETGLVKKRDGGHWSPHYGAITVVMDHGEEEVPDLANLTLKLAARGLASPMGATREQAGALSVNWSMTTQGVTGGIVPTADERTLMDSYVLTGWR